MQETLSILSEVKEMAKGIVSTSEMLETEAGK
jgi:hypothetical protein